MTTETTPQQPTAHVEILTPSVPTPKRKAPPPIKFPEFEEHMDRAVKARAAGVPPRAKRPTHAEIFEAGKQEGLDEGRNEGHTSGYSEGWLFGVIHGTLAGALLGAICTLASIQLGRHFA